MVDHWDDVLSDMSAIHRYRRAEALALSPPEFYALAVRLPHYPGAVQSIVRLELGQRAPVAQPSSPAQLSVVSDAAPVSAATDPTEDQVDAMRAQARLKKFPPREYGEHKTVPLDQAMREVNTSA